VVALVESCCDVMTAMHVRCLAGRGILQNTVASVHRQPLLDISSRTDSCMEDGKLPVRVSAVTGWACKLDHTSLHEAKLGPL
jgi:hypothetical protein